MASLPNSMAMLDMKDAIKTKHWTPELIKSTWRNVLRVHRQPHQRQGMPAATTHGSESDDGGHPQEPSLHAKVIQCLGQVWEKLARVRARFVVKLAGWIADGVG